MFVCTASAVCVLGQRMSYEYEVCVCGTAAYELCPDHKPQTTVCVLIQLCTCPHTTICVLILLYTCPYTSIYVSSYNCIRVLIQLYTCPHNTTCVLILLHMWYLCPHTCSPKRRYVRVLILLHTCPHTTLYVSLFYYICVLILARRRVGIAGGIVKYIVV